MTHVYKVTEWEDLTGRWRCNDIKNLAGISSKWWVPARILDISLTDYILLLKDKFNARIESYYEPNDVLLFSWDNYTECHKYVLWINRVSREKNFMV